jgi:hypothetical protein
MLDLPQPARLRFGPQRSIPARDDLLFDITARDIGIERQRSLNCSNYNGGRTRGFRICAMPTLPKLSWITSPPMRDTRTPGRC